MIGRVVMIDGYVDTKHKIFGNRKISNYEFVDNEWIECARNKEINPHGTAIAGIISKEVSDDIEIVNFDIYTPDNDKKFELLIRALEYIDRNIECDIINLSLGTRESNGKLYNICERLHNKGIYIVSAFDNAGAISYPAAYSFVIGVDVSPKVKRKNEYVWVENSCINLRGMGGLQKVAWNNGAYTINQGSSFAAPHITAILMKFIEKEIENVYDELKNGAVYVYEKNDRENTKLEFDNKKIQEVALFPFNKEMHALVNNFKLLEFNISKIYDHKYSNNIGKKVGKNNEYIVESIEKCNWDAFDTMVIGHLSELESLMDEKIKKTILEKCLIYKKNIYAYDDYEIDDFTIEIFKKNNLSIYVQKTKIETQYYKFGKLYSIASPVLGVFGTGKRQGKYTLQLLLRYKLSKKGYILGQLSTEPNGLLFGMDAIYPIGYNGICNRNQYEIIEDVNALLHDIDIKAPDLVIVGSQSGTTPKAFNNIAQFPIQQLAFLLGSNPDAVILNVNLDDEIEYIKRTIDTIEGVGRGKVISIVIYPCCYQNGWGIIRDKKVKITEDSLLEGRRKIIEIETGVKSYILGKEEQEDELIDNCIDFFSGGIRWKI